MGGPVISTVMGSLSAMVAETEPFSESTSTREAKFPDIVPSVTEKASAPSESMSWLVGMATVRVAPAEELAVKVTLPDAVV